MAALTTSLMGLGMPGPLATALGDTIKSVTAVGTAQGASSPRVFAGDSVLLTTAGGQTACTLDAGWPVGATGEVTNITSTAAAMFPPTGCSFDGGSSNASIAIAQNRGRIIRRMSATSFRTFYGA